MSRANTRELLGSVALVGPDVRERLLLCDKLYRLRYDPSKANPRFLLYFLASHAARYHMEREATGTSGSMQNIGQDTVRRLPTPAPPVPLQRAIASFLDKKSAAIDALIAKKERLIELLEEKRQALITQAVTKGLDPNVPMKDSGIEWLGEIPAHWEVKRLRHLVRTIEQGWSPQCEGTPAEPDTWGVLKAGCVNGGRFDEWQNKALPGALTPRAGYRVHAGDILMCRASGSPDLIGSVAQIGTEPKAKLMLSDKVFRLLHLSEAVDPLFLVLELGSKASREQIVLAISGAEGLANNLPKGELVEFSLAVPPRAEQAHILATVGPRLTRLVDISSGVRRHIELLREFRQALITEAVTGKLDIPASGEDAA